MSLPEGDVIRELVKGISQKISRMESDLRSYKMIKKQHSRK